MATLDFNMDSVKPAGEFSELGEGEYVVRVETTEKKATKDKFYEDGRPHEDNGKNHYLMFSLRVGSGPDEGHIEFDRLSLWHVDDSTVARALRTLKSIQVALNTYTNNSDDFHGKFMLMRITKGKDGKLYKHYSPIPEGMSVNATASIARPSPAQAPQAPQVHYTPSTPAPAVAAKPSWAV